MACGCPLLTTKTGCSAEIVGDAALLVDPYDPSDIANGMRRILTEEDLQNNLVENGFKRVQQFSWGKCARETPAVFETISEIGP